MNLHWNIAMLNAIENVKRRKCWRKLRRARNLIGGTIEIQVYGSSGKSVYIRSNIKSISWNAGKPESFQLRRSKLFRGGRRGPYKWLNTTVREFKLLFDSEQTRIPWIRFEDSHYVFSIRGTTELGLFSAWIYIYPPTEKNKMPKRPHF